ncbi:hypothetical protein K1719_030544 [Acacia pycnantha]|nr:hypothetical protein K1719_030544 [Acacia pycnantha]
MAMEILPESIVLVENLRQSSHWKFYCPLIFTERTRLFDLGMAINQSEYNQPLYPKIRSNLDPISGREDLKHWIPLRRGEGASLYDLSVSRATVVL